MIENKNIPLVTLAIPAYNVEDYIERRLESAFNQDYQNIEFLIVPDKSTDNTFHKIKAQHIKHNKLNIRILPPPIMRVGISQIRNIMLREAKGKYIVFLDSDDNMPPDAISTLVSTIMESDTQMAIGNFARIETDGTIVSASHYLPIVITGNESILKYIFNSDTSYNIHFACWGKIYSLEFLRKNNVDFHKDVILDDWVFFPKLLNVVERIAITDRRVYDYTVSRPNSLMNNKNKELSQDAKTSWIVLTSIYTLFLNYAIASQKNIIIPFLLARLSLIATQTRCFNTPTCTRIRLHKLIPMIANNMLASKYLFRTLCIKRNLFYL